MNAHETDLQLDPAMTAFLGDTRRYCREVGIDAAEAAEVWSAGVAALAKAHLAGERPREWVVRAMQSPCPT